MTKTALTRLQDEIDAVRREAFAEGYAAAMRVVRELASQPAPEPVSRPTPGGAERRPPSEDEPAREDGPPRSHRLRRGTNAKLIESVLRSIAPRAARPTEIRNVLQREQGVALAFTSIRHALGQLQARQVAEQVAHSRSWRYLGSDREAG